MHDFLVLDGGSAMHAPHFLVHASFVSLFIVQSRRFLAVLLRYGFHIFYFTMLFEVLLCLPRLSFLSFPFFVFGILN